MTAVPSILVVEHHATTRKMLRLALLTEGYRVVEAADARAALAAAQKTLPDLVLQDLILPDMDGRELLRRLRALPGGAELPILVLSGFLSRLEEARTDDEGFTALLVKPIEPSRLLEAIRVYLSQPPALTPPIGEGRRLLVVDDDPVQLKLTRIHCSQLGFRVTGVSGASDALIAARANRPDVILSDVLMPGTDGFDLCLEIRRDPDLATVPLVLLSGEYGSKADEDLARRVGASALVLRTPGFGNVAPAILEALQTRALTPAEQPSDQLALTHARLVIHQLERQAAAARGLAQRCGIQAAELSLLSGVANALTGRSDPDVALQDVLAATLDAAGISKGALILRNANGTLELRQDIGFSEAERSKLQKFFGHGALLEDIVNGGGSVAVPSPAIPDGTSWDILAGANLVAAQIVPLMSDGRGVGAMVISASGKDVTSDDCVAFARAVGNQVVQSLELARSVANLSQERDRAQRYLDTAEVVLLATDVEGRVTLINRKGCDLLGWTERELLGRDFIEMCLPVRIRIALRQKHQSVLGGDVSIIENPILTRSGEERLIEWHNSTERNDAGHVIGTFSSGTDITERNQAVEALRTSEERMRFALKNADVGIWDMDYTTGVLRWSEIIEAHYGVPRGTFGGTFQAFVERIHPDDRASLLETVGKAMKDGTDFVVLHRSIWPDGTVRWLSGAGRIHLGEHGEPLRGVGISQDVTARKRAEAEVKHLNDEIQLQRLRVFKATMRTVQDIVNNVLNGFQLVRLEAEGQLPGEMLTLVDQVIHEASVKLKTLGDLETVTEREMALGPGIDYPGAP